MKLKIMSVLAAFAMVAAFSLNADAQYMTQDVIFVKAGYIPVYTVTFDEDFEDDELEFRGFALQGEYNLNFDGFWLGFGLEYQYTKLDVEGEKNLANQFILPMASIKIAAVGGLYVGGGVSAKYLIATEKWSDGSEAKKKVDLWANGILGYHMPIGEGLFLDLEGRFGWNLTNKQFSEYENVSETYKMKNAYDIAFYAGIGFRALGSNY
ncbi:MAG: hypothetical protein JXN64_12005 [Spirochaetes bacterium]|nr:hypothetical protein [Spirochaetota bacterium]